MGLDLLEFGLAVEEAFHFRFPAQDMPAIATPRQLIDYLTAHLPAAAAQVCLSQRAFYRLRGAVAARVGCPRSALRPDTSLLDLIPPLDRSALWEGVRQDIGATSAKYWPRLDDRRWFDFVYGPRIDMLREAVLFVVARLPLIIKGQDAGWTRGQVSEVVHGLIGEELGLQRHQYTEDSRWDKDMGVA